MCWLIFTIVVKQFHSSIMSGPDRFVVMSLSCQTEDSHAVILHFPCWSWAGHCQVSGTQELQSNLYYFKIFYILQSTIYKLHSTFYSLYILPWAGSLAGTSQQIFFSCLLQTWDWSFSSNIFRSSLAGLSRVNFSLSALNISQPSAGTHSLPASHGASPSGKIIKQKR